MGDEAAAVTPALIPHAGHELFVDQPRAFLEAAEEFLSGKCAAAARPYSAK